MDNKEQQRDIFIHNYMREDFQTHCQHFTQCWEQDEKVGMIRSSCGACDLNTRQSWLEANAAYRRLEGKEDSAPDREG